MISIIVVNLFLILSSINCFLIYRINGKREAVEAAIKLNYLKLLMRNDQLLIERSKQSNERNEDPPPFPSSPSRDGFLFDGFMEPTVQFPPTYKFDVGTSNYDSSKKNRTPAWTDRILYKVNSTIRVQTNCENAHYNCVDTIKCSDHKPVFAIFELRHLLSGTNHTMPELCTNDVTTKERNLEQKTISPNFWIGNLCRSFKCNKVTPL